MSDQSNDGQHYRQYQGRFSGGSQNNSSNQSRSSYDRNNRKNNNNHGNHNRSAGTRSLQTIPRGHNEPVNQKQEPTSNRKISHQPHSRPNELQLKENSMQTRKISAPARTMTERKSGNFVENPELVADAIKKLLNSYQCGEMTLIEITEKLSIYKIEKTSLVLLCNWSFDQHDEERSNLSEILCECTSRGLLSENELIGCYKELLEIASELVCDLPHVYRYIGETLALPVLKRILLMHELFKISKVEIERRNGSKIIENLFKVFESKFGKNALRQLFIESGDLNAKFLEGVATLNDFLTENVSFSNCFSFISHHINSFSSIRNWNTYCCSRNRYQIKDFQLSLINR